MPNAPRKKRRKKKSGPLVHGHLIHVRYMEAVPKRATQVAQHLHTLDRVFSALFADENFVTLLRAETMTRVPAYFQPLLKGDKT
jgi:hypothetical protein